VREPERASRVVDDLRVQLGRIVHGPGDERYSVATRPDNSSYTQQPSAVITPRSAEQVAEAVRVASHLGSPLTIQATGHGAVRSIRSDEVLLDVSALTGVTIDLSSRTARVGAGSMWPEVQQAAYAAGLLGLSGTSPTVGVAGYLFGGGVGWLVRKHGLASAALRTVEYVDGTGVVRCASEDAADPIDREALWAFRGGSPVGIATSVEIGLFEVPNLATGYLLWPAESLPDVLGAWAGATGAVTTSVTSCLSVLKLPGEGPFPDELLGEPVVHLSYASPDGVDEVNVMREAVREAAVPAVDTTGPGDLQSLSVIHLDPPAAVPARGIGRWLAAGATEVAEAIFDAARVGDSKGLNMIELRHTDTAVTAPDGALTSVPATFLLHAVGVGADDEARAHADAVLSDVMTAGESADIGLAAPSFCEGQPDVTDGWLPSVRARLVTIRESLDPREVLRFQRHPVQ
jgi:hypothetical protein